MPQYSTRISVLLLTRTHSILCGTDILTDIARVPYDSRCYIVNHYVFFYSNFTKEYQLTENWNWRLSRHFSQALLNRSYVVSNTWCSRMAGIRNTYLYSI